MLYDLHSTQSEDPYGYVVLYVDIVTNHVVNMKCLL